MKAAITEGSEFQMLPFMENEDDTVKKCMNQIDNVTYKVNNKVAER